MRYLMPLCADAPTRRVTACSMPHSRPSQSGLRGSESRSRCEPRERIEARALCTVQEQQGMLTAASRALGPAMCLPLDLSSFAIKNLAAALTASDPRCCAKSAIRLLACLVLAIAEA